MLFRQQEAVSSTITQLELICPANVKFMVKPVQARAATVLHLRQVGLLSRCTSSDGITTVRLEGTIDGKNAGATQERVLPLIPSDGKLLLDMSAVTYLSSAGLRMLLLLYRQTQAKRSRIALVGLSEEIRDTMSATGFLDYFITAPDEEEGRKALAS